MIDYKEPKKRASFQIDDDLDFRLRALARIHYEGNFGMLCRALIMMSLEDVESGHKKIGIR